MLDIVWPIRLDSVHEMMYALTPFHWRATFSCDDCAAEASRVVSAGGQIQRDKTSIGEYGFIVLAFDTEGNMFGLHSRN